MDTTALVDYMSTRFRRQVAVRAGHAARDAQGAYADAPERAGPRTVHRWRARVEVVLVVVAAEVAAVAAAVAGLT